MAETTSYLLLALGVSFGTLGLYLVSLVVRLQQARHDENLLETLADD